MKLFTFTPSLHLCFADYYWRGFLGSNLSSVQLLAFALLTFLYAPVGIKIKLVSHLMTGGFLLVTYYNQPTVT
jgi:lycopene epsilon-cyclase